MYRSYECNQVERVVVGLRQGGLISWKQFIPLQNSTHLAPVYSLDHTSQFQLQRVQRDKPKNKSSVDNTTSAAIKYIGDYYLIICTINKLLLKTVKYTLQWCTLWLYFNRLDFSLYISITQRSRRELLCHALFSRKSLKL